MHLDAGARPRSERGEVIAILISAAAILAATNGPTILLAVHLLHQPINLDDWHFTYAITAIGAIGIVRVTGAWQRGWRPSWFVGIVAALAMWIVLSATWSVVTTVSTARATLTAGVVLFAVSFSIESLRHQVCALALGANTATLSSAVTIVVFPSIGRSAAAVTGTDDYFQGIFANRNSLGPVCALAIIGLVGVALTFRTTRWWIIAAAGSLMNMWLLWGTRSATAVVALVAAAAAASVGVAAQHLAQRLPLRRAASIVTAAFVSIAVLTVIYRDQLLDLLGRDSSLSNRRQIWTDVLDVVARRPLQGYGFWAFWDSERVWEVYNKQGGYQFGSAHNSVVEMALGTGWPGAALFVAVLVLGAVGVVRWNLLDPSPLAAWWGGLVAMLIVVNMTESFVLFHSYVLMLLVSASLVPWWHVRRSATPTSNGAVR